MINKMVQGVDREMGLSRLVPRLLGSSAIAGALFALYFVAPAAAQQVIGATNAQPSEGASGDELQEIVVTAQRREQSLQRVPVSVTALSGDQLQSRQLNTVHQLTVAFPSLTLGQSGYFAVRGVGTLALSSLLDQSVGVALDDVSLGVPGYMSFGLIDDVAQVEVLEGPQGLLFGRNASSGLINVRSNKPVIGEFSGNAYVEFDDRDSLPQDSFGVSARAAINVPVSDSSALRINVNQFYQDPIVERVGPVHGKNYDDDERIGFRAKYLWNIDDKLSAYLIGDYSDQKMPVVQGTYRRFSSPADPTAILSAAEGIVAGPNNFKYGADGGNFQHIETGGVSLHLNYELSDSLTLSNIAAWRFFDDVENYDFDFTAADLFNTFMNHNIYDQYSDELRLELLPGGVIDGQVGLYTFIQQQTGQQLVLASAGSGIPNLAGSDDHFTRDGQSYAAFGQFNLHATDQLIFIMGGRVTQDHVSLNALQNTGTYDITLFGPTDTHTTTSTDNTNFSYRLGAQYQITPDIMAYAAYSTGYKAPSFNQNVLSGPTPGSTTDPLVHAETASNWEVGLKTMLFDRHLRLNISAFYETFHNLQVQYRDPFGNFVIGNAGKARTKGVEVSAEARPVDGLTVNVALTAQHAYFINYAGAPCYPGQGCTVFNAGGLDMPTAPRFSSTLDVRYEKPISEGLNAFVQGDYTHRSSMNFLVNQEPGTNQGDSNLLGFSAGLHFDNGLEVSIFCRNCTDHRTPEGLGDGEVDQFFGYAGNIQSWGYNSVRTIGASATYDF